MVVSGHATLGLPQITLETDGDDIFATGVIGLIFGYHDNRIDPASLGG
jgi:arsenite oxidase small subunit